MAMSVVQSSEKQPGQTHCSQSASGLPGPLEDRLGWVVVSVSEKSLDTYDCAEAGCEGKSIVRYRHHRVAMGRMASFESLSWSNIE